MPGETSLDLDRLFYPRSIVVVGATPKREKKWSSGNAYINASISQDFPGKIYPVHPKAESILGFKSYRRISEIPDDDLDLAIFTVPARVALEVIDECAQKGVKFVHLLTAGFTETGREEYADLEKKLIGLARKGGVRIVGPNCMGLYCPEGGLSWTSDLPGVSGPIGVFSQSGQLAYNIVTTGASHGLSFSKVVSYGNASDLSAHDFLNYLARDEKTKIVGGYIEGLRDGRSFLEAAKNISAKKPLVVWKGGQTESGSRASFSHTAAIAGSQSIWRSMCKQAGIIPVNSVEEMVFTLSALKSLPLPQGPNVAILGGAGGGSVTMTDAAEKEGLNVARLSPETISGLEKFVSLEGTSSQNPLDILAAILNIANYKKVIGLLKDDPMVHAIIFNMPVAILYRDMKRSGYFELIKVTIEAVKKLGKPLLPVMIPDHRPAVEVVREETTKWFHEAGVATFLDFQIASRALSNMAKYRDYLAAVKAV